MNDALLKQGMSLYLDSAQNILKSRGDRPDCPITTIPTLNHKVWGLKRGQVHIIAARASQGKSAFAMQLAWDCAVNNKKVLFLSLEMTVERLLERLFCNIYQINNLELQYGKFAKNPEYQSQWVEFTALVKSKPFILTDLVGKTWKELDTVLNGLDVKPDVIVVDHINHIKSIAGSNDKQIIDDYLENFHDFVKANKIIGILCAQINRVAQGENEGEPQEHNLKGTGKLEEIADVIFLLWWPYHANEKKPKNEYRINISKNRDGMTGKMSLNFIPQHYCFSDYVPPTDEEVKQKNKRWLKKPVAEEYYETVS